ncbi:MAG: TetR/AcrR family transcriptional regulator [Parvibaculaceae bacterium]|nr:TetR/AcrR family transcriptional regulator [Parvibaculaceae bacterium]
MSVREEAKEERRQRIVAAARRLIDETGETGFSMRALAEAAGVSLVTPYNLFGSKLAVMLAMLDDDVERYQARLGKLQAQDAIEMFFAAVRLARDVYEAEPRFYRSVFREVNGSGDRALVAGYYGPRLAFWRGLTARAQAEGHLRPEIDIDAFTQQLSHVFGAHLLDWAGESITLDEMEDRISYGFSLLFLAALADSQTPAMRKRMLALQDLATAHGSKRRRASRA